MSVKPTAEIEDGLAVFLSIKHRKTMFWYPLKENTPKIVTWIFEIVRYSCCCSNLYDVSVLLPSGNLATIMENINLQSILCKKEGAKERTGECHLALHHLLSVSQQCSLVLLQIAFTTHRTSLHHNSSFSLDQLFRASHSE